MVRAICVTAVLLTATAAVLPAQRNRDRDRISACPRTSGAVRIAARTSARCARKRFRNLSTVDLDARGNGGVAVRGWDRADVQMRARVTVWDDSRARRKTSPSRFRSPRPADGFAPTVHAIGVEAASRDWDDDRYWSVAYELQVPRKADLRVDATNGGIVDRRRARPHRRAHRQRRHRARRRDRRHQGRDRQRRPARRAGQREMGRTGTGPEDGQRRRHAGRADRVLRRARRAHGQRRHLRGLPDHRSPG